MYGWHFWFLNIFVHLLMWLMILLLSRSPPNMIIILMLIYYCIIFKLKIKMKWVNCQNRLFFAQLHFTSIELIRIRCDIEPCSNAYQMYHQIGQIDGVVNTEVFSWIDDRLNIGASKSFGKLEQSCAKRIPIFLLYWKEKQLQNRC